MSEPQQLELGASAALPVADVLSRLDSSSTGLSSVEASRRLGVYGPNALLSHGVSAVSVLVRQLRSYLLLLLFVAAVVSAIVGDRTEAAIIGGIMLMSVGLSFLTTPQLRPPSPARTPTRAQPEQRPRVLQLEHPTTPLHDCAYNEERNDAQDR